MAVDVRAVGTPVYASGTDITLSIPAGVQAGDLLIAFIYDYSNSTFTQLSGPTFTEDWDAGAAGYGSWAIYSRWWQSGDGDVVFRSSVSDSTVGCIIAFSGVDTSTKYDVGIAASSFDAPGSPYDVTLPAFSTGVNDALAVFCWGSRDDNEWAYQSGGGVERVTFDTVVGSDCAMLVATKAMATAGTTGDQVGRQTLKGGDPGRILWFSLKPIPVGPEPVNLAASFQPGAGIVSKLPKRSVSSGFTSSALSAKKTIHPLSGGLPLSAIISASKMFFVSMVAGLLHGTESIGATWSYNPGSGKWTNTPATSGGNLVTDGDMELDNLTYWPAQGTPTTREKNTTSPINGVRDLHLASDAASEGAYQSGIALTADNWYVARATGRCDPAGVFKLDQRDGIGTGFMWVDFPSTGNTSVVATGREVNNGNGTLFIMSRYATPAEAYVDDVSVFLLDKTTLPGVWDAGSQSPIKAYITTPVGVIAGVVSRYSDSNNFVLAVIDRYNNKASLYSVIAGAYTTLIAPTAATYVANAALEIRWNGSNTAQLFYNGSQIGSDQDVSSVPAGTYIGYFATDVTTEIAPNAAPGSTIGLLIPKALKNLVSAVAPVGVLLRALSLTKLLSAGLSFVGRSVKWIPHACAHALSFVGTLVSTKTFYRILAGALTSAGALVGRAGKAVVGSLTPSGEITEKSIAKSVYAGLSWVGSLAYLRMKLLVSAISFVGAVGHSWVSKVLVGAIRFFGRNLRKYGTGLLYGSGVTYYSPIHTPVSIFKVLAAALNSSGQSVKKIVRALVAALTSVGSLATQFIQGLIYKTLEAGATFAGAVTKKSSRALTASVSFVGKVVGKALKKLVGAINTTGVLVKRTARSLVAVPSLVGRLTNQAGKVVKSTLNSSGRVVGKAAKVLTATLSPIGVVSRKIYKILVRTLSTLGELATQTTGMVQKSLSAALSFVGSVPKHTTHSMTSILSFVGRSAKKLYEVVVGAIQFVGSVSGLKAFMKALTATFGPSGVVVKKVGRVLTSSLGLIGAAAKLVKTALSATITFVGRVGKGLYAVLASTLSFVGTLAAELGAGIFKNLSASMVFTGEIVKQTRRTLIAVLFETYKVVYGTGKIYGSGIRYSVLDMTVLLKVRLKDLAAAIAFVGRVLKKSPRALVAAISFVGTLPRPVFALILSATTSFVGVCVKMPLIILRAFKRFSSDLLIRYNLIQYKMVSAFVRFSADLNKGVSKGVFTATVQFFGAVIKRITTAKFVSGIIRFVGRLLRLPIKSMRSSVLLGGSLSFTTDVTRHLSMIAVEPLRGTDAIYAEPLTRGPNIVDAIEGYRDTTPDGGN